MVLGFSGFLAFMDVTQGTIQVGYVFVEVLYLM